MNESNQVGYFHRVNRLTPTRFWINNPTEDEADRAIEAGAVSCTTNPTYVSKMLASSDRERIETAIRDHRSSGLAGEEMASVVQRAAVKPIQERFLPLYRESGGKAGFVSIQGDPIHEDDPDSIVSNVLKDRELGANIIAKVPVTAAGLQAISTLISHDVPVIATEVMSVAQGVAICEAYMAAAARSGNSPEFYVTHITGIFDEYLRKSAAERKVGLDRDILWAAGVSIARKLHRIMKERSYPGILLGGGARELSHFTEFVGADVHVTINWRGTAETLIEQDPPVVSRFDCPVPQSFVDELEEAMPEFRSAYHLAGLEASEFSDFGPVKYFRDSFIRGWRVLLEAITESKVGR